jgi:predicted RNase H-like HicB family nuclease
MQCEHLNLGAQDACNGQVGGASVVAREAPALRKGGCLGATWHAMSDVASSRVAPPSAWAGSIVADMNALTFNAVFEDAGDGWVYVHVPELPEVHTQGKDLDEAREMVRDAIELVLEERRSRGEPIPEPGWAIVERVEIAA